MNKLIKLMTIIFLTTGCKSTGDRQDSDLREVRSLHLPSASAANISTVSWTINGQRLTTTCEPRPGKAPDIFQKCAQSNNLNRLATGSWTTEGSDRTSPVLELTTNVTLKRSSLESESETVYLAIGARSASFKTLAFKINAQNGDLAFTDDRYSPDLKIGGLFAGKTDLRVLKVNVPFPKGQKVVEYALKIENVQIIHHNRTLADKAEITIFGVDPVEYARIKAGTGYPNGTYHPLTSLRLE